MATYRLTRMRWDQRLTLILFVPSWGAIGAYHLGSALTSRPIELHDRGRTGPRRPETRAEKLGLGILGLTVSSVCAIFVARDRFLRIRWDSPCVTAYDAWNRVLYQGKIRDIVRVEGFVDGSWDKWHRVIAPDGTFSFPDEMPNAVELLDRIEKAIEHRTTA